MIKVTNIQQLGKVYTIKTKSKVKVKNIRIIHEEEILDSVFGEYGTGLFSSFADYLKASCAYLTGYVEGPEHITWYSANEDGDIDAHLIAKLAYKEGNRIVVIQKDYDCIDL